MIPTRTRPTVTKGHVEFGPEIFAVHGDKARPEDFILHYLFLQGKIGDMLEPFIKAPSIIDGLVVSKGVGDTINITTGNAFIYDGQTDLLGPHAFDGSLLANIAVPKILTAVNCPVHTNAAIPSANLDGAAVNYVKLTVKDTVSLQRAYYYTQATMYDAFTKEGILLTVDTVAPAAHEILLATFVGTAGGAFVFSANPDLGQRASDYGLSLGVSNIHTADGKLRIKNDATKFVTTFLASVTANRLLTFPDRNTRVGAIEDWVANSYYGYGDPATHLGSFYRCITPNNDAAFTIGKWEVLSGNQADVLSLYIKRLPFQVLNGASTTLFAVFGEPETGNFYIQVSGKGSIKIEVNADADRTSAGKTEIFSRNANVTNVAGTAGKINVYEDVDHHVVFENLSGGDLTFVAERHI